MKIKVLVLLLTIILITSGCNSLSSYINEQEINIDIEENSKQDSIPSVYVEMANKQAVNIDLDKDGVEESISAEILNDGADCIITVKSSDQVCSYKESGNFQSQMFITDFETRDEYIEFYILDDGPSGDPTTHVFRFQDNQIIKVNRLDGFITAYDGEGRIYTEYSRTWDKFKQILSYYELEEGAVYVVKQDLIGKPLQYDCSLILFDGINPNNEFLQSEIWKESTKEEADSRIKMYDPERIVKVCEPNELLKIVDIDNTCGGLFENGSVRNIRIKVETADGKRGWLEWMNGGD